MIFSASSFHWDNMVGKWTLIGPQMYILSTDWFCSWNLIGCISLAFQHALCTCPQGIPTTPPLCPRRRDKCRSNPLRNSSEGRSTHPDPWERVINDGHSALHGTHCVLEIISAMMSKSCWFTVFKTDVCCYFVGKNLPNILITFLFNFHTKMSCLGFMTSAVQNKNNSFRP